MMQILGEVLKDSGVVAQEQIDVALHIQKVIHEPLGEILVKLNFITTDELARAIAFQNAAEYIDLDTFVPSREALRLIEQEFALLNMILPLKIENDVLIIATAWPNNEEIMEYLQKSTGYKIRFVVSDSGKIGKYLQLSYEQLIYPLEKQIDDRIKESVEEKIFNAVDFVDLILSNAVKDSATDIHITPQKLTSHIFFRVDGVLKHNYSISLELHHHLLLRLKVLGRMDVAQHILPESGDFNFDFLESKYNIRVSTIPTISGEKIALRIMPESFKLYTLENLGFEHDLSQKIENYLQRTSGIILVTGSSGSGKTTTLYAMLRKINMLKRNVISVEDPVEYSLPFVNQIQINTHSKYTFDKALHHIARQDPDVIAIGEILDEETAKLAIRNSATGNLILSTLSGSSAIRVIARLRELNIDKYLLADGLLAIISQRLLRKLCLECKKEVEITKEKLREYFGDLVEDKILGLEERVKIYEPKGCEHCRESGYVGRICIAELFSVDDKIRDMIEHGSGSTEMEEYVHGIGNRGIKKDTLLKVLKGVTSLEEALHIIN